MTARDSAASREPRSTRDAVIVAAFFALAASVLFTIVGMILLYRFPTVVSRFGALLPWFMQTPTWVYLAAMPVIAILLSVERIGWRKSLWVCLWGCGVGLGAELLGTSTGFPFGEYSYTNFLEPKFFGLVPLLIPLSWYTTAVLAYELAAASSRRRRDRVMLGAAFMVLWDVALDPAMAYGFPIWEWHVDGFFYGMPVLNLIGWSVTSLVIIGGADLMLRGERITSGRWIVPVWLVGAALPIGISALRGMWLAVVVGLVAIAIPIWLAGRPSSIGLRVPVRQLAA